MKKISLILFILFAACGAAGAQKIDGEHVNLTAFARNSHLLNGLNIYENLAMTHDCATAGFSFGINTRPSDDNWYAWAYNFPHYGLGVSYTNFGGIRCVPGSSLGDAYTFFGYSHFDFFRSRYFSIGTNVEFGLSYMTKKWNAGTNPMNLYVGSSVLVMVGVGLEAAFNITPRWEAGLNFTVSHRSNGMMRTPNFGLNECALGLFARYNLSDRYLGGKGAAPSRPEFKKWNYDIYFSSGVHSCDAERGVYLDKVLKDGEENRWGSFRPWLRLNLGGEVSFRYHPIFATGVGIDVSYTENWRRLAECWELAHDGEKVSTCPVYAGVYLQQSFYYRDVEVGLGLGVYLFKKLGIEDSKWNYQRTLIRYHFPKAGGIFIGFAMRAHFDRSDTLEFSFGKRF